jgi:hypothetical protein
VALDQPLYLDIARRALAHARARLADARGRAWASIAAAPRAAVTAAASRMPAPPWRARAFTPSP